MTRPWKRVDTQGLSTLGAIERTRDFYKRKIQALEVGKSFTAQERNYYSVVYAAYLVGIKCSIKQISGKSIFVTRTSE